MIKNQRLRNLIGWIQLPWLIIKIRKWDLDRLIKVHAEFARIARDHQHRRKEGSFMAFKRAVARRMVIECKKDKNKVAFTRMTSQELKQNRVQVYDYMIP